MDGARPPGKLSANLWFTLEVIASGTRVRILIDGTEVANVVDPVPEKHNPRGRFLLQCMDGSGLEIRRFEVTSSPTPGAGELGRPAAPQPIMVWDDQQVRQMSLSPDGKSVVLARTDGYVTVATLADGQRKSWNADRRCVSAGFARDGQSVFVVNDVGVLTRWSTAGVAQKTVSLDNNGPADGLDVSAKDGTIAVHLRRPGFHGVGIFDPDTLERKVLLQGFPSTIRNLALSPDGTRVVAVGDKFQPGIWDLAKPMSLPMMPGGHTAGIRDLAFSPDGRLVTCSADGTVRLWDAAAGKPIKVLHTAETEWMAVRFSPDGRRVAVGGRNKVNGRGALIRVLDAETGAVLAEPAGPTGVVWCLAFSRDGSRLLAGGEGPGVQVWDVSAWTAGGVSAGMPLFNGKDLAGWEAHGDADWKFVNGELVGVAKKPTDFKSLMWAGSVRDFELSFQVKATPFTPQGNASSSLRFRKIELGQPDAGMELSPIPFNIFRQDRGNYTVLIPPGDAAKRAGRRHDYNDVVLRVVGRRVTTRVNGEPAHDDECDLPAGSRLSWCMHEGCAELRIKDIRFTDLSAAAAAPLFNGKDLTGWVHDPAAGWKVEAGEIRRGKIEQGRPHLFTDRAFRDFEISFQVRYASRDKGWPAFKFRTSAPVGNGAFSGTSISFRPDVVFAEGLNFAGLRLARPAWKPNRFNTVTVKVVGRHVTATANGELMIDADIDLPESGILGFAVPPDIDGFAVRDIRFTDLSVPSGALSPRTGSGPNR